MTATHLSTVHTQDFNGSSTGDQQATPTISNGFSRRDLLLRIMFSGEVTRVGQHLALVIFFLVDENGCASVSARDLERITGWTKTAIMDHLAEIEVFIRINYGRGRAKHVFELQGIITDEARKIASVQRPDKTVREDLHSFVREPDTNLFSRLADRSAFVREMDTLVTRLREGSPISTQLCGQEAATTADHDNGSQAATTSLRQGGCHNSGSDAATTESVTKEGLPHTPSKENTTYSESDNSLTKHARAQEAASPEEAPEAPEAPVAYPFATIALTEAEFQKLRAAYPDLDYPSDFRWVDQALKEKLGYRELAREVRLRSFSEALANRVTVVLALRKKALEGPASKDRASVDHDAAAQKNCWFDDAGRLQVANGFRIDLLKLVSGNEDKLRLVLDEIGPYVPIDFRPVDRLRKVRSSVTRQVRFHEYDLSRHAGKTPATPPTRVRNSREDDPLREDPHWWQRRCSEAFGKDNKGWNATRLGPPPGEPGSFVPPGVQRLYNHEAHETTIAYWKLRVADPKQEDPLLYGVVLIIDCREILKRIGQPATPSGNTPPRSASASSRGS